VLVSDKSGNIETENVLAASAKTKIGLCVVLSTKIHKIQIYTRKPTSPIKIKFHLRKFFNPRNGHLYSPNPE